MLDWRRTMRVARFLSLIPRVRTFVTQAGPKDEERRFVNNAFGQYEAVQPWVVSEQRKVPDYIPRPNYEKEGKLCVPQEAEIKTEAAIACMRHSCYLAKRVLGEAKKYIKPGVTTDTLDEILHNLIIHNGAYPSPLGYCNFPKSICTSINNVACHGIPDNRPLLYGDILNVDVTVFFNGYHGDCSAMFAAGAADDEGKRLIEATETCLRKAIQICKPDEDISAIGSVIEETADKLGYKVIPMLAGHGIGTYFHGPPDVFHVENNSTVVMKPGMTFTIEPVLTQGSPEIKSLSDGWTIVTVDDARTAQIEHTILITDNGCEILTL